MSRWRSQRWLLRLIGLIVFMWVLTRIDPVAVGRQIVGANWLLVLVSAILSLPFIWLKSERWRLVLQWTGAHLSSGAAFRLFSIGLLAGLSTPGQLGEFIRALGVPRQGGTLRSGLVASAVDRTFDLAMLVGMALYYFLAARNPLIVTDSLSIVLLLGWMIVFSMSASSIWALCLPVLERFPFLRSTASFSIVRPSSGQIMSVAYYTFLAYLIYSLRLYLLLWSLGGKVPVPEFVSSIAIMSLAVILPVTIAGVGTRELVVMWLFHRLGLTNELAVGFSLLVLLLYVSNALVGAVAWFDYWQKGGKYKSAS